MKRYYAALLALILLLYPLRAHAEPTPTPTTAPAPDNELIVMKATGERIVRIQLRLRELGFFNYKPTGNYQDMSVKAAIRFQQMQTDESGQAIMADGTIGAQSLDILFSRTAQRAEITASIPFGPPLSGAPTVTGTRVDWSEVQSALQQGGVYTFTDYNTGTEFSMKYLGGERHAEMECATSADTDAFLQCFGGAFNYSKRPMVLHLNDKLIAASMQGDPHGEDGVSGNSMEGHVCVYFMGSLSHVGSLPDVEHLNQINKAMGS